MLVNCRHLVAAFLISAPLAAQLPPGKADDAVAREARVEALRAKAKEQIARDRELYSESQVQDIEARYQSAHQDGGLHTFLRRDAAPILIELIAAYPKSHRSGCAALKVARLASGKERERYLKEAIANHGGAWCESGVQVGALARALLAVQYAGSGKFDEAERYAKELLTLFPGAVDDAGAPLDDVLEGIRLLRERTPAAQPMAKGRSAQPWGRLISDQASGSAPVRIRRALPRSLQRARSLLRGNGDEWHGCCASRQFVPERVAASRLKVERINPSIGGRQHSIRSSFNFPIVNRQSSIGNRH